MTTVDLTSVSLGGTGSGTTRTFDYGDQNGVNFTLTMTVEGASDSGNPGGPALTGSNVSGRLEYSTGNGPGTTGGIRVNRITITSNRALDNLSWGVFGISGSPGEYIAVISNGGSQSGMGAGATGTVSWSNLDGATSVSFDYWSESDGNNACFGPIGNAVLTTGGGDDDDGDTYIRPGTVYATGAPTTVGVYEGTVSISDANGFVEAVPVRFEVLPGNPPVLTSPNNQTNDVGDAISLQLSSTNPNSHTLVYSATNLPAPLQIDEGTGLITGTLTTSGSYEVELVVKDEWGQCSTVFIDWDVSGEDDTNIDDITGPVVMGRYTGTGPQLPLEPLTARRTIDTYSTTEIDEKDAATLTTIRDGIIEAHNTLKKLKDYLADLISNAAPSLHYTVSSRRLSISGGDGVTLPLVTSENDGMMSASDKEKLGAIVSTTNHISSPGNYSESTADGDMGYRRLNLGGIAAAFPLTSPLEILAENSSGTRELARLKNALGDSKFIFRIGAHGGAEAFMYDGSGNLAVFIQCNDGSLNIELDDLPTSSPGGSNKIWNDGGTLKIT